MRYTSSIPATCAAHNVASSTRPSEAGGTHRARAPTPATRAGAAHMSTVEG